MRMFMMKGMTALFMSLAIGYILCILAKKQEGLLKTVGYVLGIAILVISLLCGAIGSITSHCMMSKHKCGYKAMKNCGVNFEKGQHK
ncbi:MAG: hypothetical protein HZA72_00650 [Candidatus Omnitrophica bacterium]|nr:hypothetical protein [Candidatus Omnitrophota bacterium]